MNKQDLYRSIPKVDQLMEGARIRALSEQYGSGFVLSCVRDVLNDVRAKISDMKEGETIDLEGADHMQTYVEDTVEKKVGSLKQPALKRVINATGTVLHTNLGRAPLSKTAARHMAETASGYVNIEYDLTTGARGKRAGICEDLLVRLTGAEDALIVNNNAAAMLLILNTFCRGHEVIVSRGELVEIGGQFRMPDVMEAGGAILKEVGTTNKTHLRDYDQAITQETAAILKVHTSNYQIVGFTEGVSIEELAPLAEEHNLILIEDLGSGALIDLAGYGIGREPTVQTCVRDGADLVCFSADKLLGGPQAGIVLGRRDLIQKMKAHPMMRALRVDKIVASALEMTLIDYLDESRAVKEVPALSMLTVSEDQLQEQASKLALCIRETLEYSGTIPPVTISSQTCIDQVGGGSMPTVELSGYAVRIHRDQPADEALRLRLLAQPVPIAARFADGDLWLSVRTIDTDDYELIAEELVDVLKEAVRDPGEKE